MGSLLHALYFYPDPHEEEIAAHEAESAISQALARGDAKEVREAALRWSHFVSSRLGIELTDNWKFFKRSLVAKWFGRVQRRKFFAGWCPADVLKYAETLEGHNLRISLFPPDIACHATSLRVPAGDDSELPRVLETLDRSTPIEVFPESSNERTICFRRYSTQFGESVLYEAGKGQAMFVFEAEQGVHHVATAIKKNDSFAYGAPSSSDSTRQITDRRLRELVERHEGEFSSKVFGICRMLGIEYLALEGYFDYTAKSPIIVDLDLPFDVAFMNRSVHSSLR